MHAHLVRSPRFQPAFHQHRRRRRTEAFQHPRAGDRVAATVKADRLALAVGRVAAEPGRDPQDAARLERDAGQAAQAGGVSTVRIIRRHIVPNLLGVVIVYATLTVPQVILVESFLSFLGLGVQEPMTSWGALVNEGTQELENAPWMLLFPATWLALTLFCFNFVGDGLRDALDPRDRSSS